MHVAGAVLGALAAMGLMSQSATAADPPRPPPPATHPWSWTGSAGDRSSRPATNGSTPRSTGDAGSDGSSAPCGGDAPAAVPAGRGWIGACLNRCGPFAGAAGCRPQGEPAVTPQALLQRAIGELKVPVPAVRTAPPRGSDGMVGIPEWFWLDRRQAKPRTLRVSAGQVWVELTAAPQNLVIQPVAGRRVTCPGAGTPYSPGAQSECSYTYTVSSAGRPSGAYRVTAAAVWGGTWRGSGGAGGTLDPITRSTTFNLRIAEGQALTSGGRS